jgi:queuine tRNA-ribosyltransferase
MSFELVPTPHGATLRDRETGETMHPNGPALEAHQLFVTPARLAERLEQADVLVLDVGLGAGSNALAALRVAEAQSKHRLHVYSFERTDTPMEFALANAGACGLDPYAQRALRALLKEGWDSERVRWRLIRGDLPETLPSFAHGLADVVFWDPWSTRSQPQLWNVASFTQLRKLCGEHASVHTFSGATAVRVALVLAGFAVGVAPSLGPKQKRSTIASTSLADIAQPLDHAWIQSLSASGLPIDAPSDWLAQLRAAPQFR